MQLKDAIAEMVLRQEYQVHPTQMYIGPASLAALDPVAFKQLQAAGKAYAKIAVKANARLQKHLSKFEAGKIDKSKFLSKTRNTLSKAYKKAFLKGSGYDEVPGKNEAWLKDFSASQFKYLEGFASAIEDGTTIMGTSQRMGMYAEATRAAYWAGSVAGSSRNAEFDWVLGPTENCDDCIELSDGGPYRRNNLPTVPGAGDTVCGSNCKCQIVRSE